MNTPPRRRRSVLAAAGGVVVGLAGCLGDRLPEPDEGDALVAELWIRDRATGELVADTHHDHWHGSLPAVRLGSAREFDAEFIDADRETIRLGDDEQFEVTATVAEASTDDTLTVESRGDHVLLTGEDTGEAELIFRLSEANDTVWEAPPTPIEVTAPP